MKKPILLSLAFLSLGLAACGKSDNTAVVDPNAGAIVATAPVGTIYPVPPGYTGISLQQYCQYYSGQYNGTTCNITQTANGSQWSAQIGNVNTGLYVYSGERVSIADSGVPAVFVGSVSVGSGNLSFIAQTSGYLGFQKYSLSTYSIQSIQITMCLSQPGVAVACN
ncbi:MAG: hypothetical protein ACXVB9_21025 [Bdellovibrionota bacterium]